MGTNYPASIDTTATFPTQATLGAHELYTDPHSQLHGNIGDAIQAVETYIGTSVSPAAGSLTQRLNSIESYGGAPLSKLTPKSVSSNYTAAVGDLVVIDSGATPPTITLPAAPADKSLIAVTWNSWTSSGGTVSIVRGGTDSIEGGVTTLYLRFLRQGYLLQYWAAQTRWITFPYLDYDSMEGTVAKVHSPVFTGIPSARGWQSSGLGGAQNASRWVGGVSGANPTNYQTWLVGDYVVDLGIGGFRVCTTSGAPGVWQVVGPEGRAGAYRTINATATLANTDYIVAVDSTSAAVTVNLPTAVGITGKEYRIKRTNSGANSVTIDPNSTQTIDGALTLVLSGQWDSAVIVSDGANWLRV